MARLASAFARFLAARLERFLEEAGFERGPWLAVGFAAGIALWFALANRWEWLTLIAGALGLAGTALAAMRADGGFPYIRQGISAICVMVAAGCVVVWAKSALVGTVPIAHPVVADVVARVLERTEEPAYDSVRLVIVLREPATGRIIRARLAVAQRDDVAGAVEGAVIRARVRLMPPAPPRLPGGRDMARESWFSGLAATGSALGPVEVAVPASGEAWLARARHAIWAHVQGMIPGSAGGIAATLVSGNRGGISAVDQQAMRDAGLTHLLAISGLHVSAVVAGGYLLSLRLLALWPWLTLRLRLPLVASGVGALCGVTYTLMTGAHLATVRACLGALLVLSALVLGRQALGLRLLGFAAILLALVWPEEVVGPSYQMSFGAVVAIIALHGSAPMAAFMAHRDEPFWARWLREGVSLVITGMVIDLALMPVALFHFHRAGVYGSIANLIAIPLTIFAIMPLIALSLVLDLFGAGAPGWWLCGKACALMLAVTHFIVSQPGAVGMVPGMGGGTYALFVAGMLWLALWRGRMRLLGLVPAVAAALSLALLRAPDVLITGDARNIGITSPDGAELMVLRQAKGSYSRQTLLELAGMSGTLASLDDWPGAHCNHDFCLIELARGGRVWRILAGRGKGMPRAGDLARGCAGVDIVVVREKVSTPCHPALLLADKTILTRTGGIALDLVNRTITTVEDAEGEHPWWRAPHRLPRSRDWEEEDAVPAEPATEPQSTPLPNRPERTRLGQPGTHRPDLHR